MIKNEKYSERYVGEENIKKKISEIKSLIYKFYEMEYPFHGNL